MWNGGNALRPVTVPQIEPMRIWHLLTHTAGLTYGFHHAHPVDRLYREAGFEWTSPAGLDLAGVCDAWAAMPLLFQPGSEWNYSVATDVLGRVVEVVSGQPLDRFLAERILEPARDARHVLRPAPRRRRAPRRPLLARPGDRPRGRATTRSGSARSRRRRSSPAAAGCSRRPTTTCASCGCSWGGGELDGVRILGPRTLAYMGRNHLPGGADLEAFGRQLFAESAFDGIGFGLGFSVVVDPAAGKVPSSAGELAWGGAASTAFYVDPVEDLGVVFLTQLLPSSAHAAIRPQLRQLVSQALVD